MFSAIVEHYKQFSAVKNKVNESFLCCLLSFPSTESMKQLRDGNPPKHWTKT